MSTNLVRLDEYVAKIARGLGLAVGLGLSIIIFSVVATFAVLHYRFVVQRAFSTHVENFAFWVQVNDGYQIQRALAGIVDAENIYGAVVTDSLGTIIAQKGRDNVGPELLKGGSWALIPNGILLRYHFNLLAPGITPGASGRIVFGQVVPFLYLGLCFLSSFLLVVLSIKIAKLVFILIASRLTNPVQKLASMVELAKGVSDLKGINSETVEFAELKALAEKIGEMSERLVGQETLIQKADRASEIFKLSRQVAHDIRSPVSALKMAIQSAKELDHERRSLVLDAAERIDQIASDLLDHARAKAAATHSFDLIAACEQIFREKSQMVLDDEVSIRLSIPNGEKALFTVGEKIEFQRLLSNLINNSVEALCNGGNILINVTTGPPAGVEILDDGSGISPEVLENLKRGMIVSTKPKGNGLGLAHARSTMNLWGGNLSISTAPGMGTKISLSLPFAPASQNPTT